MHEVNLVRDRPKDGVQPASQRKQGVNDQHEHDERHAEQNLEQVVAEERHALALEIKEPDKDRSRCCQRETGNRPATKGIAKVILVPREQDAPRKPPYLRRPTVNRAQIPSDIANDAQKCHATDGKEVLASFVDRKELVGRPEGKVAEQQPDDPVIDPEQGENRIRTPEGIALHKLQHIDEQTRDENLRKPPDPEAVQRPDPSRRKAERKPISRGHEEEGDPDVGEAAHRVLNRVLISDRNMHKDDDEAPEATKGVGLLLAEEILPSRMAPSASDAHRRDERQDEPHAYEVERGHLQRLLGLVHVGVGSARVGEAVVDRGVHVAGGKSVQLLLRHLARLVVAHDGELVHVELLAGLELVRQHPRRGFPDVLVHGRRHGADHPAVAVAVAHAAAYLLGMGAPPQLIPGLVVKVAHNELLLGAVAGHYVAVGVDEERVERHIAREQALLPIDVVDEAHVEVRAEPLLGLVGLEELVYQVLEVLGHHGTVLDDVLRLDKVEAVVQAGGGELHAELVGKLVQLHQVRSVAILHRHAKAHVRVFHFHKLLERLVAAVEAILETTDLIVGLLQALDGDANSHLGEFLGKSDDAIRKEAIGGNDDTVGLLVQLAHDICKVGPDKGLTTGDVGEVHTWELLDHVEGELLLRTAGSLVAVAHGAARVAAVGDDDGTVEFLFDHLFNLSKSS